MTLYSYIVRYDDGAAPNPYWGTCTLVICKPKIRSSSKVGDWIIGLGAKNSPNRRDHSGEVVYIMQVTEKMTMREYDRYTSGMLPEKVPDLKSKDKRRWLGDSIYDFSLEPPKQRQGVHTRENIDTDLSGEYALLSTKFVYFGNQGIPLPQDLQAIIHQGQGHRAAANAPYADLFAEWWQSLSYRNRSVLGNPQLDITKEIKIDTCAAGRKEEAEEDIRTNQ